jgi:hypothetical protein
MAEVGEKVYIFPFVTFCLIIDSISSIKGNYGTESLFIGP